MLIKRYPNRKLYNTKARHYISLAGIAALLRAGEGVQIIDHASGEDITAATLAQILAEQERRRPGTRPGRLLANFFQAGEETAHRLRQILDWPAAVDDEIRRRMAALVERGELTAEEGQRLLEKLLVVPDEPALPGVAALVERMLAEQHLPTRKEISALNDQLDDLLRQFDSSD